MSDGEGDAKEENKPQISPMTQIAGVTDGVSDPLFGSAELLGRPPKPST